MGRCSGLVFCLGSDGKFLRCNLPEALRGIQLSNCRKFKSVSRVQFQAFLENGGDAVTDHITLPSLHDLDSKAV